MRESERAVDRESKRGEEVKDVKVDILNCLLSSSTDIYSSTTTPQSERIDDWHPQFVLAPSSTMHFLIRHAVIARYNLDTCLVSRHHAGRCVVVVAVVNGGSLDVCSWPWMRILVMTTMMTRLLLLPPFLPAERHIFHCKLYDCSLSLELPPFPYHPLID